MYPTEWAGEGQSISGVNTGANDRVVVGGSAGGQYTLAYARCGFVPLTNGSSRTVSVPSSCTSSTGGSEMMGLMVLNSTWDTALDDVRIRVTTLAGVATEVCLLKYPFTSTASQHCQSRSATSLSNAVEFDVNLNNWSGAVGSIYLVRVRTTNVQMTSIGVTVTKLN